MRVTKMHGAGNDYVYLRPKEEMDWPALAARVSTANRVTKAKPMRRPRW